MRVKREGSRGSYEGNLLEFDLIKMKITRKITTDAFAKDILIFNRNHLIMNLEVKIVILNIDTM